MKLRVQSENCRSSKVVWRELKENDIKVLKYLIFQDAFFCQNLYFHEKTELVYKISSIYHRIHNSYESIYIIYSYVCLYTYTYTFYITRESPFCSLFVILYITYQCTRCPYSCKYIECQQKWKYIFTAETLNKQQPVTGTLENCMADLFSMKHWILTFEIKWHSFRFVASNTYTFELSLGSHSFHHIACSRETGTAENSLKEKKKNREMENTHN